MALDITIGLAVVAGVLLLGCSNRALERWIIGLIAVVAVVYLIELVRARPGTDAIGGLMPTVSAGSFPMMIGIVGCHRHAT